jgi:tetratricopeptide (TPR) repeat protein
LLPVATPDDLPLVHFRKGYCTLAHAAITHDVSDFEAAAGEFDKAMQSWPLRPTTKNKAPEPISPSLLVLASIARLATGPDDSATDLARNQIAAAVSNPACSSMVVPSAFCEAVLRTGRQWLGWLALRNGDLTGAAKQFSDSSGSGWPEWIAGRQAFDKARYREASADYERALALLHSASPSIAARLGPPLNRSTALTDLGSAQLLAGEAKQSIVTFDAVLKADSANARAYYLRARAKETAGDSAAALADYNLASRTAFAGAKDLASGEAHLYRGILLYRRKDYAKAEDEFASALNFEIAPSSRADAVAWRHLAAVRGGSCEASRDFLERSLSAVSPYFPKDEARAATDTCRTPNPY